MIHKRYKLGLTTLFFLFIVIQVYSQHDNLYYNPYDEDYNSTAAYTYDYASNDNDSNYDNYDSDEYDYGDHGTYNTYNYYNSGFGIFPSYSYRIARFNRRFVPFWSPFVFDPWLAGNFGWGPSWTSYGRNRVSIIFQFGGGFNYWNAPFYRSSAWGYNNFGYNSWGYATTAANSGGYGYWNSVNNPCNPNYISRTAAVTNTRNVYTGARYNTNKRPRSINSSNNAYRNNTETRKSRSTRSNPRKNSDYGSKYSDYNGKNTSRKKTPSSVKPNKSYKSSKSYSPPKPRSSSRSSAKMNTSRMSSSARSTSKSYRSSISKPNSTSMRGGSNRRR